jgi:hypothetical protein
MATLYITEFPNGALIGGTAIHTTAIIAEQSIGIEDASVASKPFSLRTDLIMVEADYPCCLAFGKDPKADPGKHRIAADRPRIYGVMPGDRIAVIAAQ